MRVFYRDAQIPCNFGDEAKRPFEDVFIKWGNLFLVSRGAPSKDCLKINEGQPRSQQRKDTTFPFK